MCELSAQGGRSAAFARLKSVAAGQRAHDVLTTPGAGAVVRCAHCQGLRGWELLLGRLKAELMNP